MRKIIILCLIVGGGIVANVTNLSGACTQDASGVGSCVGLYKYYINPVTMVPYAVLIDYYCSDRAGDPKCVPIPE